MATKAQVDCYQVSIHTVGEGRKRTYDKPPKHIRDSGRSGERCCPSLGRGVASQEAKRVSKRLQNHDATQPSMNEIVRVEGNAEQPDEGIVPPSQDEQRNHVDDGEDTRPVPHQSGNLGEWQRVVDGSDAKSDVGSEVGEEEGQLEACWQSTDINGRTELKFAVVSLAEYGRVQNVLLEP